MSESRRIEPRTWRGAVAGAVLAISALTGCSGGGHVAPSSAETCNVANDFLWYANFISGERGDFPQSPAELRQSVTGLRGSLTSLEGLVPNAREADRQVQLDIWTRMDKAFAEHGYDLDTAPGSLFDSYRAETRRSGETGARLTQWAEDDACGGDEPQGFPTKPAEMS